MTFSFSDLLLMFMVVMARTFALVIQGKQETCLVPLAGSNLHQRIDMFNYNAEKSEQTIWNYDNEMQGFVLSSCQYIHKGEEIFVDYGEKSNWRLLLYYGFTQWPNKNNDIPLELSLTPKSMSIPTLVHDGKKKLLHLEFDTSVFLISAKVDLNFKKMLGFLRSSVYHGSLEKFSQLCIISYILVIVKQKGIEGVTNIEKLDYISEENEQQMAGEINLSYLYVTTDNKNRKWKMLNSKKESRKRRT